MKGLRKAVVGHYRKRLHQAASFRSAIFVNGAKEQSALQLSRDLDVQYKTAFVLSCKIREALHEEKKVQLTEEVEVDKAYFGGHVKPANREEDRKDLRLLQNQTGKRRVVGDNAPAPGKDIVFRVHQRSRCTSGHTKIVTTEQLKIAHDT